MGANSALRGLIAIVAILLSVVIVLVVLGSFAAVQLGSITGGGGSSIDRDPVSLQQARDLIQEGRVSRIYIRNHGDADEWCYFRLSDGDDPPCRWKVDGVDVHLWSGELLPSGVPILSEGDDDSVGLTDEQFTDLLASIDAYNETASAPLEVFDQR